MSQKFSPPAFPCPVAVSPMGDVREPSYYGMSLKEYYTGVALQGILTSLPPGVHYTSEAAKAALAADSAALADALIAELEK